MRPCVFITDVLNSCLKSACVPLKVHRNKMQKKTKMTTITQIKLMLANKVSTDQWTTHQASIVLAL